MNYYIITSLAFFLFQVEVGDVILKVNETDVNRFSTKEGKCKFKAI